ncbi:GNAT family N-acetyltransferase [Streptacidiphilus cavernicola]|uniref:GNAT family N-acetyltransferase n=1 Tax=Streptacidiphilus cavernicola TaxID=3342716 RepID=A0ABV6VWA6_9ACTN
MDVELLPASALGEAEAARWRRALAEGGRPVHPVLSPDFATAVGRVRPEARIAVLRDGDLHGWLAFEPRGRRGVVGEVIGKGFTDVGGLPIEPGLPVPDCHQLLRACGLAVWRLVQADPGAGPLTGPPPPGTRLLGHAPNPVIDLSAGYQAHLAHLRRHAPASLRTVRKHERRLARDDDAPVRYVFEERDPRLLEVMLHWKNAQYRASGWTDPLAAARGADLARSLAELRSPGCTGAVSVLYLGDEPAAVALTLRSQNTMACCVTGYNQRHAAHSPGTVLLGRIIESAADLGIATVDLGEGDQEYKQALMTSQLALPHGLLWRPGITAMACLARDSAGSAARDFITSRPRLRSGTRATLRRYGALRGCC